ncbi:MAG: hypothetical protein ACQERF_10490 [Actinomycetota bacterium]
MGSPQQTATCPVCGTRAIVDPKTKKVRPHLRKGGMTCDGQVERPAGLARLIPHLLRRRRSDDAAPDAVVAEAPAVGGDAEEAEPSGPVRIRVDCPVCGRYSAVDPEEIRIRLHKAGSGRRCPGTGMFPEVGSLTIEGITVGEVRQRRRDAMGRRRPAEEKKPRGLLRRRPAAD